jgi:hypothetical protein
MHDAAPLSGLTSHNVAVRYTVGRKDGQVSFAVVATEPGKPTVTINSRLTPDEAVRIGMQLLDAAKITGC